jgi:hypothetical protein
MRDFTSEDQALVSKARFLKTAGFLHREGDVTFLEFETGSVPRRFMVLVALGKEGETGFDASYNGVVVLDADTPRIVTEKMVSRPGKMTAQIEQAMMIRTLKNYDWKNFVNIVSSSPGFRPGTADIDQKWEIPMSGRISDEMPLMERIKRAADIRSAFSKELHEDSDLAYSFPKTDKMKAVLDIFSQKTFEDHNGNICFGWKIDSKDETVLLGRSSDGLEVSEHLDAKWLTALKEKPEILSTVAESIVKPYFETGYSIFELGEASSCDFDLVGDDQNCLILKSFAGDTLSFDSRENMVKHIMSLSVENLERLWMSLRVLNSDLSPKEMAFSLSYELNMIRHDMETEWAVFEEDAEPAF